MTSVAASGGVCLIKEGDDGMWTSDSIVRSGLDGWQVSLTLWRMVSCASERYRIFWGERWI